MSRYVRWRVSPLKKAYPGILIFIFSLPTNFNNFCPTFTWNIPHLSISTESNVIIILIEPQVTCIKIFIKAPFVSCTPGPSILMSWSIIIENIFLLCLEISPDKLYESEQEPYYKIFTFSVSMRKCLGECEWLVSNNLQWTGSVTKRKVMTTFSSSSCRWMKFLFGVTSCKMQ